MDGRTGLGPLCFEGTMGSSDLSPSFYLSTLSIYCSSGVRNGKTKKNYPCFLLVVVIELSCMNRNSGQNIAREHKRTDGTPPPSSQS